jgi:hypothetical protein
MKTRKSTAAGILILMCGTFDVWYRSGELIRVGSNPVGIALGLIAIAGGIFALRRKVWGLALAGAICAVYPAHPWGPEKFSPLLGLLAIVLVVLSKKEFSRATRNRPEFPPAASPGQSG